MLVRDCGVDVDACDSKAIHHVTLPPAIGLSISCDGSSMRAPILMFRTVEVKRHCIRRARMTIWNVSFYSSQLVQTCTFETQMAGLRFTGLLWWSWSDSCVPILNCFVAADADLDAMDNHGITVRQLLARWAIVDVESARRRIAKIRLDLVRNRAMQVCIGLQSLGLDALQMCEILQHACCRGRLAQLIPFHIWWKIATTVKHFQQ
jgi:hypothetical protein